MNSLLTNVDKISHICAKECQKDRFVAVGKKLSKEELIAVNRKLVARESKLDKLQLKFSRDVAKFSRYVSEKKAIIKEKQSLVEANVIEIEQLLKSLQLKKLDLSLIEDDEAESGDLTCVVCFTNKRKIAGVCGHLSTCCKCAEKIVANECKCPICRIEFTELKIIYV